MLPRLPLLAALFILLLLPLRLTAAVDNVILRSSTLSAEQAAKLTPLAVIADQDRPALAPPAPLFGNVLVRGGQAHVLAAALTGPRELTVFAHHAITNTWANHGRVALPAEPTALRPAPGGFLVELQGSPEFVHLELVGSKRLLAPIDWVIIVAYLGFSAGIGLWIYLREKKTSNDDFFLGGRNIPWWAAGLSLYATGTSAISFIAIPAKSFATNWQILSRETITLFSTALVAIYIVPLIRRLNVTSVYHYLEMRFHPSIRVLASALNILIQLGGRMSTVLYLPALALSAVTGVGVMSSIMVMGIVTIIYTLLGGMKAVIWTDVLQVFVMLGGALFAIGYVIFSIDGGFGEFVRVAAADGKLHTFDWSFDLLQPTMWAFMMFAILDLITYPKDQVMMQRALSTRSAKEAGWSMWTLAAIVVPGSFTFFAIGTALYVFYKQHPEKLNPLLSTDSTFPQFIAAELPVGVTGLIIAGIFAASMSTLSSCMNSVATLVSVDFYERFNKKATPAKSVRLAEWITVIAGLIGVGTAVLLALFDIKSAFDAWFALQAVLGGGFAGCYGLGMFTKRANWQGTIIGVAASLIITLLIWQSGRVAPILYPTFAIAGCLVFGYVGSLFFPAPSGSLAGLTVYTRKKNPA
ncbi:MAG: sodium:solute symporter [Opitutaceae bacterium]|nr:sodium:solute symporter [Opitutaceae bacterium]